MQGKMIAKLIAMLMSMLTPNLMKGFADMALDFVEDRVLGSKSKVDDMLVLPVCDLIRTAFDIPDNDEE